MLVQSRDITASRDPQGHQGNAGPISGHHSKQRPPGSPWKYWANPGTSQQAETPWVTREILGQSRDITASRDPQGHQGNAGPISGHHSKQRPPGSPGKCWSKLGTSQQAETPRVTREMLVQSRDITASRDPQGHHGNTGPILGHHSKHSDSQAFLKLTAACGY